MAEAPAFVTLVSNDGFEFIVQRSSACISGAIKKMLDPKSNLNHSSSIQIVTDTTQMASKSQQPTSADLRTSSTNIMYSQTGFGH